ncbi:hypothetical protein H9636_05040 [Ureibacillus sp. Re31]|uniref:YqzE-like protein n=1 Tax=Ureibacillus galli TaxID=2762222 RepID=A0ABR8X9M2_9BACL|nr:hypothetical protein [Ureibacillus galli]MBD8026018.1 hypothetical protein [Ureibacillus galli]
MKGRKRNKAKKERFYSDIQFELLFEVVWNIVMFLPRMVARLISNIW